MKHDIESHNFTGVHTDHDEHAKKAKQTATAVGLVKVVYTPVGCRSLIYRLQSDGGLTFSRLRAVNRASERDAGRHHV